ncbi:Hypothetical predicted protein [Mytilus galloprovincialis]|uniref:C-type lectin domain-containing protein n=1 Tax=Mytilus galloprovincialis TaxID=29158 RepID=A0A8B6GDR4_MYTGA|nr:Hypothetical predicted protein [Mytilus galloprovincialis]
MNLNCLHTLILCILSGSLHSIVSAECPLGWFHYDGSCLLFSTNTMNWYNANGWCRAHNARLVEVASVGLMAYLRQTAKSYGHDYWLGGSDEVVEGLWQWSSIGKKITVSDWDPWQPDNFGNGQNCLRIWNQGNYHWDYGSCSIYFVIYVKQNSLQDPLGKNIRTFDHHNSFQK